jgi:GTP-binding protein
MFIDEAEIFVRSGKGGDGMVHFRREKYINRGGPDGGDGGRGGSIILRTTHHLNTLEKFRHQMRFIADDGKKGGPKNQTGKSANDLIIDLPPGTLIYNKDSGELIADLVSDNQEIVICQSGRGGRGNARFANARIQAPRIAEKGEPGIEKNLKLELKLIADIGIIGMPNAGKSSFLAAVTNAKPKIADYPFTTLVPNLGVAALDEDTTLVLADIPGLIEGAHTGLGLGDTFLRHIQRTRVLIHLLDGNSKDPLADFSQINSELSLFDPELGKKSQIVVINKIDMPEVSEKIDNIREVFMQKGISLFFISALTRKDIEPVLWKAKQNLEKVEIIEAIPEMPIYHPKSKEKPYIVKKENEGWRIEGAAIERAAAMTYWEYFASVRRFHRILVSMGIEDALNEKGVVDGDTVLIGDHELVWSQEWIDDEE